MKSDFVKCGILGWCIEIILDSLSWNEKQK